MKITVIAVGKIKEKYLKDALAEYSKRLSRYCRLEILEAADEKRRIMPPKPWSARSVRKKESESGN